MRILHRIPLSSGASPAAWHRPNGIVLQATRGHSRPNTASAQSTWLLILTTVSLHRSLTCHRNSQFGRAELITKSTRDRLTRHKLDFCALERCLLKIIQCTSLSTSAHADVQALRPRPRRERRVRFNGGAGGAAYTADAIGSCTHQPLRPIIHVSAQVATKGKAREYYPTMS